MYQARDIEGLGLVIKDQKAPSGPVASVVMERANQEDMPLFSIAGPTRKLARKSAVQVALAVSMALFETGTKHNVSKEILAAGELLRQVERQLPEGHIVAPSLIAPGSYK